MLTINDVDKGLKLNFTTRKVLGALVEYYNIGIYQPTYRELLEKTKFKSLSTISSAVKSLAYAKIVTLHKNKVMLVVEVKPKLIASLRRLWYIQGQLEDSEDPFNESLKEELIILESLIDKVRPI